MVPSVYFMSLEGRSELFIFDCNASIYIWQVMLDEVTDQVMLIVTVKVKDKSDGNSIVATMSESMSPGFAITLIKY